MVKGNRKAKKAARVRQSRTGEPYSRAKRPGGAAVKCARCNRLTLDPSGLCVYHTGPVTGPVVDLPGPVHAERVDGRLPVMHESFEHELRGMLTDEQADRLDISGWEKDDILAVVGDAGQLNDLVRFVAHDFADDDAQLAADFLGEMLFSEPERQQRSTRPQSAIRQAFRDEVNRLFAGDYSSVTSKDDLLELFGNDRAELNKVVLRVSEQFDPVTVQEFMHELWTGDLPPQYAPPRIEWRSELPEHVFAGDAGELVTFSNVRVDAAAGRVAADYEVVTEGTRPGSTVRTTGGVELDDVVKDWRHDRRTAFISTRHPVPQLPGFTSRESSQDAVDDLLAAVAA